MLVLKLIKRLLSDIHEFTLRASLLRLRTYQLAPARAIIHSALNNLGHCIVVIMPRQSGKNELQAQLETFLLRRFSKIDADMVKASPTWKPQSLNAMRRLERVLSRNILTKRVWKKEAGYIYRVGLACISFLSAAPETNIVGQTANLLLQVDEAQDVQIAKFDKDIVNMAASTNATKVFWGTMWTSQTLLARELRAAREAEKLDGLRRVFVYSADDVRKESDGYGHFVDQQVMRLGRNHPLIRTQLYSEEIDTEGGMFNAYRQALMHGTHPQQQMPLPDVPYAMLIDVAGEDELAETNSMALANEARDHTALTIVQVDLATLSDELIRAPRYLTVFRREWVGDKHTTLYTQIKAIAEHWQVRTIVIDATGVGTGLASFLEKAFPDRVIKLIFSPKVKSQLGWGFLAVVETGRYREYTPEDELQRRFWQQVQHCTSTVQPGPDRSIRWGVSDGTRDNHTGELVHDDLLISAALCTFLDQQVWGIAASELIAPYDPIADMEPAF